MPERLTIAEAIGVGLLGVFAFGTARGADHAATERDRKIEYPAHVAGGALFAEAKDLCIQEATVK